MHLLEEYKFRYDKETHKCDSVVEWLTNNIPKKITKVKSTKFQLTENVRIYEKYLADQKLVRVGDKLRFQFNAVKKLNHDITPREILKQRKAFRGPAIIRNIYSEILNVLQVTVMKKQKHKKLDKKSKKLLDDAMMTSIAGISAAIKNTG